MSKNNSLEVSVVVPLYRTSTTLKDLVNRLTDVFLSMNISYEIILVNDGSPENDWEILKEIIKNSKHITGINLSRNFGQHYAITAGLTRVTGRWIVVMDGDLQDKPEEIPNLYKEARKGFDIVYAQRLLRKDSFLKKLGSKVFYKTLSYMTDTVQDSSIANFGIYKRKVVLAILDMKDSIKYFPTMSQWVGFKKTSLVVEHSEREEGESGYSLKKLIELALNNIIAFSNKPLKLVVKFGFYLVLFSFLIAFYYLFKYFRGEIVVLGYASLVISLWFLSGCVISILGVIGIYLGKVFDKLKDRPVFIIDEVLTSEKV